MARALAFMLAALLAIAGAARAAEPTGVWRFEPAALEAVADRVAAAMAAELTPERRREMLTQAKDKEAAFAALEAKDPQAAQRMAPELRRARALARIAAQPQPFFKRQFLESLGDPAQATFTLEPDGTVVYRTSFAGREVRSEGAWGTRGQEIELVITLPAPDGGVTYLHGRGPLKEDRLELRYVSSGDEEADLKEHPELARAMREAAWVLLRQP